MAERRAGRFTQGQLAAEVWPGDSEAETKRKGDISKIERGKVANPHPTTVKRISDALGISAAEIEELRRLAQLPMGERLQQVPTLSRDDLELLAGRFGISDPYDRTDADLRGQLMEKAKDWRALRAEVEAIDDGLKRLSNLKAAARGAVEAGDLEEVETILSRVQEVELEEAARTAELRADNALLRGRVDQAYRLLSAAADSFAGVDAVEPARRYRLGAKRLWEHGLRYGGGALAESARMSRTGLTKVAEEKNPVEWAALQNELANALQTQGSRTAGEAGAALLAEAVAAYRAALRVRTEAAHPVDWAMTQENMALAEKARAEHDCCADPRPHWEAALGHVEAALRVYDPVHMPYDYGTATELRDAIRAALDGDG